MPRIIEIINRRIPSGWRTHIGCINLLAGSYKILSIVDQSFSNKLNRAVASCGDCELKTNELKSDMIKEFIRLSISPEEYARFRFFEKNRVERDTYLSDIDVVMFFKWGEGNNILPNNKYERYSMFQPYFHRDVIRITFPFSEKDYQELRRFISDKQSIILKPLQGTQGHGIQKIDTKDIIDLNSSSKIGEGEYLAEELIVQGEELAQFHPSSVNTVRLVTGRGKEGQIEILFALLRVGKGGSLVDNVGSGGLVSLIDLDSGAVCTDAFCGTERYSTHPDTGSVFKGSIIPSWDELCATGIEMHQTYPGQKVFGFDFAWTNSGWDVVEVNPAPSFASYQSLLQKGCRPLLAEKKII